MAGKYAARLKAALKAAKAIDKPMTVSEEAAELWHPEYRRLETERAGDLGKAVARLSVHCLKVAMLYAALDGSQTIHLAHLKAALALMNFCEASAASVFGKPMKSDSAHGEAADEEPPHARLLTLIRSRPDGIIRRDAHHLFNNHRKKEELNADFRLLTDSGYIVERNGRWYSADSDTGGGGETVQESPFNTDTVSEDKRTCEHANCERRNDDGLNDVRSSHVRSAVKPEAVTPDTVSPDALHSSQFACSQTDEASSFNPTPVIQERGLL